MEQGIAALAGAAIGILGTAGAAHFTGRAQRAQWRRQARRDAYSVFSARYDAALRVGRDTITAIRTDRVGSSSTQQLGMKIREVYDALTPV
ncbi:MULTISPECIES: hypothetical protein [unclassified Streptomyces]|uniref:hypothetical protein n=1 Tax=unclassified Streptomyces TaxID=2593676 RepID=UPI0016603925|nr:MULTISPECIES: hypothetical protein [unclassified Streptomyces]